MRAPNRSPIESKERPENRTVDLLGTFFCVVLLRALPLHVAFLYTVLLHAALSRALFLFGCNSPASARTGKRRAIIAVLHHL